MIVECESYVVDKNGDVYYYIVDAKTLPENAFADAGYVPAHNVDYVVINQ